MEGLIGLNKLEEARKLINDIILDLYDEGTATLEEVHEFVKESLFETK